MLAAAWAFLAISSGFASTYADINRTFIFENAASVVTTDPTNANQYGFSSPWGLIGEYTVTVYIQGQPFQLIIDSGSSDLWIYNSENLPLDGLVYTGYNNTDTYGDGSQTSGPIVLANVSFGEYTVQAQSFMDAGAGTADLGLWADGLLGVSSPLTARIFRKLADSPYNGFPFLSNVFNNNPDMDPFTTFYLTRTCAGVTQGGAFTISELVKDYKSVVDAPKLPIYSNGGFITLMDGIYVNGELLNGNSFGIDRSIVDFDVQLNKNQTTVILDTGTTLISAPPYYVDAIYKNVPGAVFDQGMQTYQIPCTTKLNISMVFGENVFPMDPLDAVFVRLSDFTCFGAMQYAAKGHYVDFILGSTFLRNTYTLFHWGNWTQHGTNPPYAQLLSLTDPDQAWANFDSLNFQRLGQISWEAQQLVDNVTFSRTATQSVTYSLIPASATDAWASATTTPASYASSPASWASTTPTAAIARPEAALEQASASAGPTVNLSGLTRNSYIIMGLVGGVLVLLLGVLIKLISDGRNQQYRAVSSVARPPMHFNDKPYEPDVEAESLAPYDDPARMH